MANKGKVLIDIREREWVCGDGCCTEYGYDVIIEIDGKVVLDQRYSWDYNETEVEDALRALGYTVETNTPW